MFISHPLIDLDSPNTGPMEDWRWLLACIVPLQPVRGLINFDWQATILNGWTNFECSTLCFCIATDAI
jgi:hypothetical protein